MGFNSGFKGLSKTQNKNGIELYVGHNEPRNPWYITVFEEINRT